MAKKEFRKQTEVLKEKEEPVFYQKQESRSFRISGLSGRSFSLVKFIFGICFLPFVYAHTVGFLNELYLIDRISQKIFWAGLVMFLFVHLLIWEPAAIYAKGQRILEIIFSFFRPLVRVAPFLLPIYTVILFVLYGLLALIFNSPVLTNAILFLAGFSAGLHLIFSARSMRTKQKDFLKANYIFGFSLVYIINLIILSFCLSLVFKSFSFLDFVNNSFQIGRNIFYFVFRQLFL